jgi:Family of unknown function (DUF6338)
VISAADVASTLRYLVPGFIALRVFYWFGLKNRRSDLELTIWSLAAALLVDRVVSLANPANDDQRLGLALGGAVLLGALASAIWRLVAKRWPRWSIEASATAWDAVLVGGLWVNVWTEWGDVIFGTPRDVALSAETDTLDLYLEEPQWVEADGTRTPKPETAGLLIARDKIRMIEILRLDGAADTGGPKA